MELLLWLLAFDRRLSFWCLSTKQQNDLRVNIWIMPLFLIIFVLCVAYLSQQVQIGFLPQCSQTDIRNINDAELLSRMVMYQRMILAFLMLASLANYYTTDLVTTETPKKDSEPFEPKSETIGDDEGRGPNSDYERQRHRKIMMSWSSSAFLIAAVVNLAFSLEFAQALLNFARSMAASDIHNCEIPGSVPLAAYACFVVLPIGALTILVYMFAICRAVAWFFSKWFVFVTLIALDRYWYDFSRDFAEYRNEFDFDCD